MASASPSPFLHPNSIYLYNTLRPPAASPTHLFLAFWLRFLLTLLFEVSSLPSFPPLTPVLLQASTVLLFL